MTKRGKMKKPIINVWGFLKGIPKPLWSLVAAAICVLGYIYYKQSATQNYWAAAERLCLSVLSSFIFYLIVVRYKEWYDKKTVAYHFHRRTMFIVG
jgi:membrane protein YdbS with pleckstrin-like domain